MGSFHQKVSKFRLDTIVLALYESRSISQHMHTIPDCDGKLTAHILALSNNTQDNKLVCVWRLVIWGDAALNLKTLTVLGADIPRISE
jgi:hypothetical protein